MSEELTKKFAKKDPVAFVTALIRSLGYSTNQAGRYKYKSDLEHDDFTMKLVAEDGGEGDGAPISLVFEVQENGKHVLYFEVTGTYSSWADTEYDSDIVIVKPKQVKVTQWFPV
jgi:hypothetical protein